MKFLQCRIMFPNYIAFPVFNCNEIFASTFLISMMHLCTLGLKALQLESNRDIYTLYSTLKYSNNLGVFCNEFRKNLS